MACGDAHTVARTEMQTCAVWGDNTCGQLGIGAKTVRRSLSPSASFFLGFLMMKRHGIGVGLRSRGKANAGVARDVGGAKLLFGSM